MNLKIIVALTAAFSFLFFSCSSMSTSSGDTLPKENTDAVDKVPKSDKDEEVRGSDLTGDDSEGTLKWESDSTRTDTKERDTPTASGLKAGFADDNRQFNYFINFLKLYESAPHYEMKVGERIILKVADSQGKSIPNAAIEVSDGSGILASGKSYADGSFLFFPAEYGPATGYRMKVTAMAQTKEMTVNRNGGRLVEIKWDSRRPDMARVPLDIVFVMDTTGSMTEEINRLKTTIEIIKLNLSSLSSKPVVRFGMILFRDKGEEYVTRLIPLSDNLETFQAELDRVDADGGGDVAEDLQSAMEAAVKNVDWNPAGIRLAFIVTDAPPHLDYGQAYTYLDACKEAKSKAIKFFSVGTGGLNTAGEYVLRQIAQYTYGKYIFLTYGETDEAEGGKAGSVSHHTGANFQTDKLETIIIRFAKEELSYLTDQPLTEEGDYFEATRIADEEKEKTLQKLFDMAISQLVDFSSIRLEQGVPASLLAVASTDDKIKADAEYVTDQLGISFSRSKTFKALERIDLQKAQNELELQLSGLVDDATAVKLGRWQGAAMLITGNLYKKEKSFELFLKLIRVETAEVLAVTKAVIDPNLVK